MATITICHVCNDYSVEIAESRVFRGASELRQYLASKYGVKNMARISGANPDRIAWHCYDIHGDWFLDVYEK